MWQISTRRTNLPLQVQVRPEGEGQIYVPVVSIAYAEKRADNLQEGITSLPGSFAAEYSMDSLVVSFGKFDYFA